MNDNLINHVKALLFDLGGVVIKIDFDRIFAHWAGSSNQDFSDIKSRFSFDSFYERHERGEIGASEYFDSLRVSLNLNINDDQFMEGWNSIYVDEIDGMAELLAELKNKIPIYAFTNSNKAHRMVWSIKFAQVLSLFNDIFVSSEIGSRKPEPAAFKIISELFHGTVMYVYSYT